MFGEAKGSAGASTATDGAKNATLAPVTHALLIEDDRKLSSLLVEFLAQHQVAATPALDATVALRALEAERFDILLVDLMLPGMDGLTLTKRIRERWNTPIIMVTARGDDADKIVGLELGADEAFDRSIDVHVSRLRAKIEPDPRHPRYVKTVRGAGYLLAKEG